MPDPKTKYQVTFESLTGGLNLYDPDYRLKLNESPDMENMLWKNGTLCSRYGQNYTEGTYASTDYTETLTSDTPTLTFTLSNWASRVFSVTETGQEEPIDPAFWSWDGGKTITLAIGSKSIDVSYQADFKNGPGYTCYSDLFWGNAFFHIGTKLFYAEPGIEMELTELCELRDMYSDYVPSRGTFLRYGDDLFYKARGVFIRIHYTANATPVFSASDVSTNAYVPITYINASWQNGSGTSYQPENRLSPKKTIWYNAGTSDNIETFAGDGTTTDFELQSTDFVYVSDVTVDGATVGNWTVSTTTSGNTVTNTLIFYIAPADGAHIEAKCQCAVKTYTLPVKATSVTEVVVDGVTKTPTTDYSYADGVVTFTSAPPVTQPLSNNTVRITYSLANTDAFNAIMDCPYAIVYGGNQNICMVVGGCTAQPNAFFWNGNNIAMDVSYWPMEQYNLGGDTEEEITGFGKQQGNLIVFKNKSVGKGSLEFTTVETSSDTTARTYIEIDYTNINSMTGCDLPWSIQLIENNLVFANTQQGVHIILDSSAAYENNIIHISRKIDGGQGRLGLLDRIQNAQCVCSFDDNKRYWLIADSRVFCWDYTLSEYKDPSWFYLTGVKAVAVLMDMETIYHLNNKGLVSVFDNYYTDYGSGYERRYQFATQFFRSYDRLKTVRDVIFTLRTDTDFIVQVTYLTDYEERKDLTDILYDGYRLAPRKILSEEGRNLRVEPFAYAARRRPGCRHVRHFSMVLTCTEAGCDMPVLSAQVFYTYEGRDR